MPVATVDLNQQLPRRNREVPDVKGAARMSILEPELDAETLEERFHGQLGRRVRVFVAATCDLFQTNLSKLRLAFGRMARLAQLGFA